jgi:lipoate-protein ligase A
MSVLHVFRDPPLDGPANMARDEHLLHSGSLRPAVLRLYAWSPPTISLGCFQRYGDLAHLPPALRELPAVRRCTGGGAILHDRELTYCLALDDSLPAGRLPPAELYGLVHRLWRDVLAADGWPARMAPDSLPFPSPRGGPFFCFERPGRTDLLLDGGKVLGSAQRRIPGRTMQHGSLILGRRFDAHPGAHLGEPAADVIERWTEAFLQDLARELGLAPRPAAWTPPRLADVQQRRARYAGDEWLRRR